MSAIGKTRRRLYRTASLLGDVEAVAEGRVGRRVVRKTAWRWAGRALRQLLN